MHDSNLSDRLPDDPLGDENLDHRLMERLHGGDHAAATAIYVLCRSAARRRPPAYAGRLADSL